MPDVELARRDGVELIRTGTWGALSGSWTPTRADILAAIDAQQCPAVRRPRLKLGHTDTRFNSGGDGEPALGWIENLRATDDGDTLIGDQVALPWLSAVQAAAYPDRSIEGNYRHKCSLGHTHPFVLTAVALLGVTPPAVSTLRSVTDLPAMLGVAASSEVPEGAEHVQVTILARHRSADFDEHEHPRGGDGKFAHSRGEALPAKEPAAPKPSTLGRDEKLAARIPLAEGELYTGSTGIKSAGIIAATVDGPDGPTLRLGVGIDPDDFGRWSGSDKGSTVVLDEHGVDALRAAIPEMFDAAKLGKQMSGALDKRDRDLQAREQSLLNRQYPGLSKADAKELADATRRVADLDGDIAWRDGLMRKALEAIPDVKDRERVRQLDDQIREGRAAGEKVDSLTQERLRLLATDPDYGDVAATWYVGLWSETNSDLAERAELGARMSELTANPVALSAADRAALDQVRGDIAANANLRGEMEDGQVIAEGTITAAWGDIRWRTSMLGATPSHDLAVAPPGAGGGWDFRGADNAQINAADLRKLAALLNRVGAQPPVQAAADWDEHKHLRDGDGQFARTGTSAGSSWAAGVFKQDERLRSRISLAVGETFAGGATIPAAGIAVAAIDSPQGRKLRIGVGILEEDLGRWSGADKGSTVVLDEHGVESLRQAVPRMLDAAKRGEKLLAVFDKRDQDLHGQEQALLNKQYPHLSKAQVKELAAGTRRQAEIADHLERDVGRQRDRLANVPEAKDRERITAIDAEVRAAAGDRERVAQLRQEQRSLLRTDPVFGGITPVTYVRTADTIDGLHTEQEQLRSRRAELTARAVPLSGADQAELDQVRSDITRNDDMWSDFNDGQVLAQGSVPGDWGAVRWQVSMSSEKPRFELAVAPPDAGADWGFADAGAGGDIDAAEVRKLGALLNKAGATAAVRAAAGDDAEPVHTSAVVMLVPTAEDAERLAVEGGEPAGELHVTLAYLGDAADLGEVGQQDVIDAVSTAVNGLPVVEAEIFSVAAFNPPNSSTADDGRDRTSCLVWGLSGDLIDAVHSVVEDALSAVDRPLQHRPWHAHITALISDDLTQIPVLAERVGPVTFDRVRMAFAGQHVDIPLIGPDVSASAEPETPLVLPAAEPEHEINPDPKEDLVSTDLSAFRSRLGLDDTADEQAILSALDALKTKADTPVITEPDPVMVAASAAAVEKAEQAEAEKNELLTEVKVLASQVTAMSTKLAEAEKEKAAAAKVTVIQAAADQGKFTPADREQWEKDYDEAPGAVTRILASIAPGTAVPITASGVTGPAEPEGDTQFDADYERAFGEKASA